MRLPLVVRNPYTETPYRINKNLSPGRFGYWLFQRTKRQRTIPILVVGCLFVALWHSRKPTPSIVFHDDWHPKHRKDRFPSVQERIQIYMSNWYLQMCPDATDGPRVKTTSRKQAWPRINVSVNSKDNQLMSKDYDSIVGTETPFLLLEETITDCARPAWKVFLSGLFLRDANEARITRRRNMRAYCQDAIELLELFSNDNRGISEVSNGAIPPLLGQFCDEDADTFPVPLFAKFRHADAAVATREQPRLATTENSACLSSWNDRIPLKTVQQGEQFLSPIIWKLGSSRHWDPLEESRRVDIPWKDKKRGVAIWRGALTGPIVGNTQKEKCQNNPRCFFVMHHLNSPMVNAGFTKNVDAIPSMEKLLVKEIVSMKELQQYKVLISLEGNDVASGLKWNLQSQSVVLMPPPTKTSWAMEELLQPWVHYIPLNANGTNAEEMVRWVMENDNKAQVIAERATLFMYDMLYHPDAKREERAVKEEIVQRYKKLWMHSTAGNKLKK